MPIEDPIVDLSSLNENWPLDEELQSEAAPQHMRLTKDAYKKAFTGLDSNGGAVNASAAELNQLAGVTGNVQAQIDEDDKPPRVITTTIVADPADKIFCNPPLAGLTVELPTAPAPGTEVLVQDVSGLAAAPDNQVFIATGGSDTMTLLHTPQSGLTLLAYPRNSQYLIFVYFNEVWFVWNVSSENTIPSP